MPAKGSAGSGPPESWFPYTWKLPIFFQAPSDSGRVPVMLLATALKMLMSTKALIASGRVPSTLAFGMTLHGQRNRAGGGGGGSVREELVRSGLAGRATHILSTVVPAALQTGKVLPPSEGLQEQGSVRVHAAAPPWGIHLSPFVAS